MIQERPDYGRAGALLAEECEEAQGFLYAKPLPAGEFENYLRTSDLVRAASGAERRPQRRPAAGRAIP